MEPQGLSVASALLRGCMALTVAEAFARSSGPVDAPALLQAARTAVDAALAARPELRALSTTDALLAPPTQTVMSLKRE
jgi:hypothetical protein